MTPGAEVQQDSIIATAALLNSDPVLRALHTLESRMDKCFHCGTKLKQWEPWYGNPPVPFPQPHKWCVNCKWVIWDVMARLVAISQSF